MAPWLGRPERGVSVWCRSSGATAYWQDLPSGVSGNRPYLRVALRLQEKGGGLVMPTAVWVLWLAQRCRTGWRRYGRFARICRCWSRG